LLENPTSDGGTKTSSGALDLPAGYYRLGIDLYTSNGVLNRSDIAHIYPGLTTRMETVFGTGDFVTVDVISTPSLAGILSG
jgi:hypothetical protein